VTYWTFLVGALAIAGVPGLAGFFSKDEILFRTFANGHVLLWSIGLVTSLLTAIYMFRVVFMTFFGSPSPRAAPAHPEEQEPAAEAHAGSGASAGHSAPGTGHPQHVHDAPPAMALALVVLAIGSVVAGYLGLPAILGGGDRFARFLEPSFHGAAVHEATEGAPALALMILSSGVAIAGIGIAIYFYLRNTAAAQAIAERFSGLHRLLLNKYYVDEIYDANIVQPIRHASEQALWQGVDVHVIDAAVNGVGESVAGSAQLLRRLQTGSVRAYAASIFVGIVAILGYYLWR
jgi:NADH-quinone oxidoreductase subunit L